MWMAPCPLFVLGWHHVYWFGGVAPFMSVEEMEDVLEVYNLRVGRYREIVLDVLGIVPCL